MMAHEMMVGIADLGKSKDVQKFKIKAKVSNTFLCLILLDNRIEFNDRVEGAMLPEQD